ncbi:chromosomal replication initiator protein DnaA [Weissella muntiaci]|uniref:Chromosomal replication initiator protein DnaA n=1 Tax=Weissella muntiaci TaxID=2508881 RepID=A0A6C2C562_9LACO|nr:chromosomal replication initiator protein DnaA [Weissella muntiaci]TYC49108.1 chromosomal replication initiator protein DnaA [Weissella muntiaci]
MDHLELWKAIKETLRSQITEGFTFNNFVESLSPLMVTTANNTTMLYLTTSSSEVADAWKGQESVYFASFVTAAMQATMNLYGTPTFVQPVVQFIEAQPVVVEPTVEAASKPTSTTNSFSVSATALNPEFRFDTFVSSDTNLEAYSVAQAVAKDPGKQWNPLMIYGGVGLGKTHLMQAIGNSVLEANPNARVKFITTETFINDFTEALRKSQDAVEQFKREYRSVDLLLVDDIQFLADKAKIQEEFFNTFNAVTEVNHQIVMTSDKLPRDIKGIEDRLVSRFSMGYSANITKPDLPTKVAILRNKAEQEGLQIPNDVIDEIAASVDTNVRELEGVFNQVVGKLRFSPEPMTVDTARNILDSLNFKRQRTVTIEMIQDEVAKYFDITIGDIIGKKRNKEIVVPRQIAMYLSRDITQESLPQIGRSFGGKDHTTVMHASDKIVNLISEDTTLVRQIQEIRENLSNS